MKTSEIKAMIDLRDEDVETIATVIGEKANRVSDTINYRRINERVRAKLAQHLNLPVEKLFDQPLATSVRGRSVQAT